MPTALAAGTGPGFHSGDIAQFKYGCRPCNLLIGEVLAFLSVTRSPFTNRSSAASGCMVCT